MFLPEGEGEVFVGIRQPQLDELGRVTVQTGLVHPDNTGTGIIYRDTIGSPEIIAQTGEPIPDGRSTFTELSNIFSISRSGNIAMHATFNFNPVFGNEGIYLKNSGQLQTIAQAQSPSPIPGVNFREVPE